MTRRSPAAAAAGETQDRERVEPRADRPSPARLLPYRIDVIGRDPTRRGVELLLASLREKRRTFRRRRRADAASASSATPAIPPGSHRMRPCSTPEAPDATHGGWQRKPWRGHYVPASALARLVR
ncbi:MAG: hypothetical protein R3D03_14150 [Geminicoccaceae bacterium]